MTTKNDITGDDIKTKPSTKAYEDGWERIFAKQRRMEQEYSKKFKRPPQSLDAAYERQAMMEGLVSKPLFPENKDMWPDDESRIDIIGQNGNEGLHYEK